MNDKKPADNDVALGLFLIGTVFTWIGSAIHFGPSLGLLVAGAVLVVGSLVFRK